jgi:phosphoribosylcarboxyaminoimidazole (NCAIR) mutase
MGDFEVTIDTLHGVVGRHGKVRDELSAANQQSRLLARIQPPMQDPATTSFITAACQAGQAHLDSVSVIEQELQTRIEELQASVEQYVKTEQGNGARMAVRD